MARTAAYVLFNALSHGKMGQAALGLGLICPKNLALIPCGVSVEIVSAGGTRGKKTGVEILQGHRGWKERGRISVFQSELPPVENINGTCQGPELIYSGLLCTTLTHIQGK